MSPKKTSGTQELLKIILDQIAGEGDESKPLIPVYIILGEGDKMCYDPSHRSFQKIPCGTRVYVIKENYDYKGRSLVYTVYGQLVCIEPEELFLLSDFN